MINIMKMMIQQLLVIIILALVSVKCDEEELSIESKRRQTETLVVVKAYYECDNGPLSLVEGTYTYNDNIDICNGLFYGTFRPYYNITVKGKVYPLNTSSCNSTTVMVNGNDLFDQICTINEGKCRGGTLLKRGLDLVSKKDKGACDSRDGLTTISSVYASLKIEGGDCEGKCKGGLI